MWAKRAVDEWMMAADIRNGAVFHRVSRLDKIWGAGITPKAIWHVVKGAAKRADIKNLAPHDLRQTVPGYAIWRAENLSRFSFYFHRHGIVPSE
jgi:integrase